jgi:hypothetical protein
MLNTVKEVIYTVGDSTGSFAKSIGLSSADLAKTIGTRSVKIAKDIGPKRAIIGAAILVVAVGGGIVLMRYLRRRDAEAESMDASDAEGRGARNSKITRAERRAQHAAQQTIR